MPVGFKQRDALLQEMLVIMGKYQLSHTQCWISISEIISDTKHEQDFEFRSMIIRKRDDLVDLLNAYLDVSFPLQLFGTHMKSYVIFDMKIYSEIIWLNVGHLDATDCNYQFLWFTYE